ncbi:MAG: flagellar biosynthesis protein FlhB [Planctomycetes bacterium]|nr:flagellar biosynthesis protein FlhB [Planctomycetota bacterium]
MAMFGDDGGKTEKPTAQRLSETRDKGDTPLSKEVVQGGVMVMAGIMFWACGDWLVDGLAAALRRGLQVNETGSIDQVPHAYQAILGVVGHVVWPLATLLATFVVVTLVFGYGQIGVKISHGVLGIKLDKINPFANWKKLFNAQAIVRTLFAVVKLIVLVTVLWLIVGDRWHALLHLHEIPFRAAARQIFELALLLLLTVGGVVFAIAIGDLFWQRYSFEKRNMMTKQEVDDERKRTEGDPHIKGRQRKARIELLRHRMMEAVPKADVIIVNPTHFSVALRYDRATDPAPIVVAKGVDEVALRIREIAREHDVPLMEDPPLARALFRATKVGTAIPEKFFQAVAVILSHVYRLRQRIA